MKTNSQLICKFYIKVVITALCGIDKKQGGLSMRTTKKIVSAVLAFCMVASTSIVSCFAATAAKDNVGADTAYVQACEKLDKDYAYNGNDLGATYSPEKTVFKVWSPTATDVKLNLYTTGSDNEAGAKKISQTPLEKLMDGDRWTGVWTTEVNEDIKNTYYTYSITAVPTTGGAAVTKETQDVYSVATGVNGERSMVCDLNSTDPQGWNNDGHVLLNEVTDSSVWEIHVKDFSYDKASGVSEENRGKFLAFTEEGTTLNGEGNISTCIDYLKELGITTVQITPFYDFESINEASNDKSEFNWGYDPQNYNVPEGSYSSNPYNGNVRINECKQMIQALHNAGISVVMDVVYNHTYSKDSCFQYTVPNYYYRLDAKNNFSNGSGCGNETATERAMFRNYVIQSCLYWVNEYHIDGFRYDLMGLMDVETMNLIREALDKVDPRIAMWGEGWTGGTSNHPSKTCTGEPFYQAIQANASLLDSRIALFNDEIRNSIKGNAMGIANKGFIEGNTLEAKGVIRGVRANIVGNNNWKPKAPSQCVTYDCCHDNATLYDQILGSTGLAPYGTRNAEAVKMNKLAGAILYTSQGVTFTLAGEEMSRSKGGDTNSYKSPADINMIKWNNIVDYADVVSYYKGMNKIKSAFSPLTCDTVKYSNDTSYVMNNSLTASTYTIGFTITNDTPGEWSKMAVVYNGGVRDFTVTLKDKTVTDWVIIANGESAGLDKLGEVKGSKFAIPPRSAIVAVDRESFEKVALKSNMGKVKVNYVHANTGKALDAPITIQGTIGSGYDTSASLTVPDTYEVSSVKGDKSGKFEEGTKEVTYYYSDYVPESIKNSDFNNDGQITVEDVTMMQKYFAGFDVLDDDKVAGLDLNYDLKKNIDDCTMLQKHLVGFIVSTGTVTVNHYYTDSNGELAKLTGSTEITGRVGSDYSTKDFKIVGYAADKTKYPENVSGKIPYGGSSVDYYYTTSSLDIKLHFKHNGSLTWDPYLWIWGSDLKGIDSDNYTQTKKWPGDKLFDRDGDGWYDFNFTYKGSGTYNVIISTDSKGSNQTKDYKGFVDNEMWVVIDDANISGGSYLKFYTANPEVNPDAPIADQI